MKINEQMIKAFIQEPYFSRGKEYVTSRSIKIISAAEDCVKGKVVGTSIYSVTIFLHTSRLTGTCTCPAFSDFGPCKHLAALGLAIIAYHQGNYSDLAEHFEDDIADFEEFEKLLKQKSKDELIAMLLQISDWYPDIRQEFI